MGASFRSPLEDVDILPDQARVQERFRSRSPVFASILTWLTEVLA
jgi:hypothetical protein